MPIDTAKTHMNKMAAKWRDGVFLGVRDASNEYFVGTPDGVFKTRNIQLKPESQKSELSQLQAITGTPWCMVPGREATLVQPLPAIIQPLPIADAPRLPRPLVEESAPRQLYIRKAELDKYGYTPGCPRCEDTRAGKKTASTHTEACRKKIEAAVAGVCAGDSDGKTRPEAAEDKRTEHVAKQLERNDKAALGCRRAGAGWSCAQRADMSSESIGGWAERMG